MSNLALRVIEAGSVFTPLEQFSPGRIVIEGGTITEVGAAAAIRIPEGASIIDASRMIATPGFIDPHIHGCGGADVMDGTHASLNTISRTIARHGTTSFLATTVSSPPRELASVVQKLGQLLALPFEGATPIGLHLEGPFISPGRRGTHKTPNLHAPDTALLKEWIDGGKGFLRLITVAPELNGVDGVIDAAARAGVVVAMGHSNATFAEAAAAADKGVAYAVHTFNAMREFTHRDPGIVGFVLSDDRIFAELIADGVHVSPSVVRIFARTKKTNRVLLITDAISATGMPDGCYRLGMDTLHVAGGICRDNEGRLAGSTLTQDRALKNFLEWSGYRFQDALLGLTANPARALKLLNKGALEPGADADIALLDEAYRVVTTYVGGKLVFNAYGQT